MHHVVHFVPQSAVKILLRMQISILILAVLLKKERRQLIGSLINLLKAPLNTLIKKKERTSANNGVQRVKQNVYNSKHKLF